METAEAKRRRASSETERRASPCLSAVSSLMCSGFESSQSNKHRFVLLSNLAFAPSSLDRRTRVQRLIIELPALGAPPELRLQLLLRPVTFHHPTPGTLSPFPSASFPSMAAATRSTPLLRRSSFVTRRRSTRSWPKSTRRQRHMFCEARRCRRGPADCRRDRSEAARKNRPLAPRG